MVLHRWPNQQRKLTLKGKRRCPCHSTSRTEKDNCKLHFLFGRPKSGNNITDDSSFLTELSTVKIAMAGRKVNLSQLLPHLMLS